MNATDPKQVAKLNAKVPELWGATKVSSELGVARNNLNKVARLPEPAFEDDRGKMWRADVIRDFASRREEEKAARAKQAAERKAAKAAKE